MSDHASLYAIAFEGAFNAINLRIARGTDPNLDDAAHVIAKQLIRDCQEIAALKDLQPGPDDTG